MLPCVVLAGGLGTRMRPATETIPKSLIPVLGRPFAELQAAWLAATGVERVVYSIGYLGEQLQVALGDGTRFGMRIDYVDEGRELRGTAGAVRLAIDEAQLPEAFFVLNGDSYLTLDLREMARTFAAGSAPVLMAVMRNEDRWDGSNAVVRDGQVLYDKSLRSADDPDVAWIDYGISIYRRDAILAAIPRGGHGDLASLTHELSRRGEVAAFPVTERFYEVGSPAGLRDLEDHLRQAPTLLDSV